MAIDFLNGIYYTKPTFKCADVHLINLSTSTVFDRFSFVYYPFSIRLLTVFHRFYRFPKTDRSMNLARRWCATDTCNLQASSSKIKRIACTRIVTGSDGVPCGSFTTCETSSGT